VEAYTTEFVLSHYREGNITHETAHKYTTPIGEDQWAEFYNSVGFGHHEVRLVPISKPEAVIDLVDWGIPLIYGDTVEEVVMNLQQNRPPLVGAWNVGAIHVHDLDGKWHKVSSAQLMVKYLCADDVNRLVEHKAQNPEFQFSISENKLDNLPPESRAYFSRDYLTIDGYKGRLAYHKKKGQKRKTQAELNDAYMITTGIVNNYTQMIRIYKETILALIGANRWVNGRLEVSRSIRSTRDPSELLQFEGIITKLTGKRFQYRSTGNNWKTMIKEITPERIKALRRRQAGDFADWLLKEQRAFNRMKAKQVKEEELQFG